MPLINNAGGSVTSALLLTLLAWSVRWLRAELNRKRLAAEAGGGGAGGRGGGGGAATAHRALGRFSARLSPVALRMLVETGPYPHHVISLRPSSGSSSANHHQEAPLPAELRGALRLPESRVAAVLGSAAAWSEAFQGVPHPPPHYMLVFVGESEEEEVRAAAAAAACGYHRAMVLQGGLRQLAGGGNGGGGDLRFIGRDGLAVLLGMAAGADEGGAEEGVGGGMAHHAPPLAATLVDVRRSDERALYGAIKGSAHIPVDQVASALALPPDAFAAQYRFAKPAADDLVVFTCRTNTRSGWAAQLAADAGLQRCLVLRQGVYGWRLDAGVRAYRGYCLQDAPPEAEPLPAVEVVNAEQGRAELAQLGVAVFA